MMDRPSGALCPPGCPCCPPSSLSNISPAEQCVPKPPPGAYHGPLQSSPYMDPLWWWDVPGI